MGEFAKTGPLLLVMLIMAACGGDDQQDDPCQAVDCSGHGNCQVTGDQPECNCDDGYHAEGLACVEDTDPCDGVDCSGHGTCQLNGDQPECICDDGYHPDGLACVEDTDPCDGVDCSGHGTCQLNGDQPECICEDGYHTDGLACVEDPPPPCQTLVVNVHDNTTTYILLAGPEATGTEPTGYDLTLVREHPAPIFYLGPDTQALDNGTDPSFAELDEAPADGYGDDASEPVIGRNYKEEGGTGEEGFTMTGNVFVLLLQDGSYAKMEVVSAVEGVVTMNVFHQSDGSRDLSCLQE